MDEQSIFCAALEIEDTADREEYLERICADDASLRERVEGLLRIYPQAEAFMAEPAAAPVASSMDRTASERHGQPLGDFRILEEIGRGGMGIVYEAEQISLGRRVALKVLSFASILDKTKLERFKIEARAAASLDHPNVVHVHSVGSQRGVHYYAMQFIEGQTVADVIAAEGRRRGLDNEPGQTAANGLSSDDATEELCVCESADAPGPEAVKETELVDHTAAATGGGSEERDRIRSVLKLVIQAAEALEHAHRMGIVHRDIKPSNLLIDDEQHLWVTDFGLAMVEAEGNLTSTGSLMGTFRYMSPEQIQGDRHVLDHHTDIYSLGATLYEMLTLRAAFPESDPARLMQKIPDHEPVAPRKLNPAVPRDLETIVLRAMAKDHEDRYATAEEMAADLRRFLNDEPIHAKPLGAVARARKWAKRHRAIVGTMVGTTSACVFIAGSLLWNERSETFAALHRETDQRALTEEESARAEANLQIAIDALDEVYRQTIATDRALAGFDSTDVEPSLSAGERHLIEAGLIFYERLAQLNGDDASIREKVGAAYSQIGWLRSRLGEHQAAGKAFEKAVQCYQKLAAEYPESQDYAWKLAAAIKGLAWQFSSATDSVEGRKKLLKQSIDAWSRYLKLKPKDAKALGQRASVYWMLGDVKSAQTDKERAIELEPDNPDHYAALCQLLKNDRLSASKVLKYAERAVRLEPNNAEYRVELAEILWKQKKPCFEQLQRALELDPKCAAAHSWLSRHYLGKKNYDQALVHADRAVELSPFDPNGHYFRAQVYGGLRDHAKTLKDLDRALELSPREGYIRCYRADILCRLERYEEAEEEYTVAINDRPAVWRFYKRRAALRFKFKRHTEALADLGEALRRNPGDVSTVTWISPALVAECPSSDFRNGMKALANEAVELNKGIAESRMARAALLNALGDFAEAKADIEAALAKRPNGADINDRLAWMLATCPSASIRNPQRATELATKAVDLDPEEGSYWNTLGVAQFRAGSYSSAVDSLTKSLGLSDGGDAFDFFFLAMAHWQLGNKAEARKWYDRSLNWMNDHSSTSEALIRFRGEAEKTMAIDFEAGDARQNDSPPEEEETPPESPKKTEIEDEQEQSQKQEADKAGSASEG